MPSVLTRRLLLQLASAIAAARPIKVSAEQANPPKQRPEPKEQPNSLRRYSTWYKRRVAQLPIKDVISTEFLKKYSPRTRKETFVLERHLGQTLGKSLEEVVTGLDKNTLGSRLGYYKGTLFTIPIWDNFN